MRKLLAVIFIALLLLIPLANGCGSENETDSTPNVSARLADQEENTRSDSLDAQVERYIYERRATGQVVVKVRQGITEEAAYQIFLAHGFNGERVEKQYMPQIYLLYFSEEEKDIRSVIGEFLLDNNVEYAESVALGDALLND